MNREKKSLIQSISTGNKMHQKTIILDLNFKHEEETKRRRDRIIIGLGQNANLGK